MLFPNVTRVHLRSLIVPDALFQHLRLCRVSRLDLLFCDVRGVSLSGHAEHAGVGAFKELKELHFNDVWWNRDFSLNDLISAPHLRHLDISHSRDFSSQFGLCSVVSRATDLRLIIHPGIEIDSVASFLGLFPRVTWLLVRGTQPLLQSCRPAFNALVPGLVELDGPFSTTSSILAEGRPVETIRLYHPIMDVTPPTIDDARAIAAGLLLSTTPIVGMYMCALRVSDYAVVLPEFRRNFQLLRKLHIVTDDDETGSELLEWIAENLKDDLTRLEDLIIGNEHILPNSGYFRRTTPALPKTMGCVNHVLALSVSSPRLRMVLLPGRRYVYRSQGHWDREMVPLDD
ncbi:hypothetical protein AURDEDRAFT_169558 [Auricularia subglabra TFB-10046 SS5]|uniref:F-box domain-containing protein n=1 Tax=Auricularia subglabra (strain TFB-10046 / SS5) TaxID=717982 RepID=J0WYS7_AURST|nr:hypothetical protein AURDEDRAFT_169558 [Auricularia subglabra TFB-10046 SS5]